MREMKRRDFVMGAGAMALAACSNKERAPELANAPRATAIAAVSAGLDAAPSDASSIEDAAPLRGTTRLTMWSFDERGANGQVVVVTPTWGKTSDRYPALIALHGRGEALKPPSEGAMGWPRDYALVRAIERLCAPPLNEDDLEGFVDPERLAETNRALVERPFAGVVVICPYLPDINLRSSSDIADYGKYLLNVVLPRMRKELPIVPSADATGIDGVSLGGAVALRVGLTNAKSFGAVGALQPAISDDQAIEWTELARAAIAKKPTLKLRLTTSHEDFYHAPITHLDDAWRAANVPHDFGDVPGPHDYPFNRGPGAIEMLTWHDRELSRG